MGQQSEEAYLIVVLEEVLKWLQAYVLGNNNPIDQLLLDNIICESMGKGILGQKKH
jgi:hypothetical protein